MRIGRTFATAFALVWATCPMLFAIEKGKQIAKREMARLVRTMSPPLLDRLAAMNVGEITMSNDFITLKRPEATYVFDLGTLAFESGVASGLVAIHNNWNGEKVGEINISKVSAPDNNRIDFSATMSTLNEQRTESGTLIGLGQDRAVAMTSVNGEDTSPWLVSFDEPAASSVDSPVIAPTLVIVTDLSPASDAGAADGEIASWTWGLGIIIGVVLFIGITCLVFGWWGCDGSFWWGRP